MKKPLIERFQKLAGIKPLIEQESDNHELSDDEKDYLHDILNDFIKDKIIGPTQPSNEKLEAALKFLILDIQNLEPFLYFLPLILQSFVNLHTKTTTCSGISSDKCFCAFFNLPSVFL
mgnify:CR=1 FL=1